MKHKICKNCGKEFPITAVINGEKKKLSSRRYCLDCVPYGSHGSAIFGKKRSKRCLNCGAQLKRSESKYCSQQCKIDYLHKEYIKRWKSWEETGAIGKTWIDVSNHVKRYLLEKYNYKCSNCGWSEINPYTNTLPLEIEHIDGNAKNNQESNLTVLCPNCHSLTKTYRGANKGNGKREIKWLSRNGQTNIIADE